VNFQKNDLSRNYDVGVLSNINFSPMHRNSLGKFLFKSQKRVHFA